MSLPSDTQVAFWASHRMWEACSWSVTCLVIYTCLFHEVFKSKGHTWLHDFKGVRRVTGADGNCTYLLLCFVPNSSRIHCCTWSFQAAWTTNCETFTNIVCIHQRQKTNKTLMVPPAEDSWFHSLSNIGSIWQVKQKTEIWSGLCKCLSSCTVLELQR